MGCFGSFDPDRERQKRQRRSRSPRSRAQELEELSFEDRVLKANSKLLRMVNASEQSSAKVRSKLADAGFGEDVIEHVLSRAIEIGVIDDVRYCECLMRSALAAGKGPERIKTEIQSLGIEVTSLEAYRIYEEAGEESHVQTAIDFLRCHPPRSKNVRDSAYRKLLSRGFSVSIATRASRRYSDMVAQGDIHSDIAV